MHLEFTIIVLVTMSLIISVLSGYTTVLGFSSHTLTEMSALIIRFSTIILTIIVFSKESSADENNFIPYKQVYPDSDLQQDLGNCSVSENGTCPLYIALMMAFDGDYITSGVIPGIQVAIDEINSDPSMLPGYTLHYTLMATRVSDKLDIRAAYVNIQLNKH